MDIFFPEIVTMATIGIGTQKIEMSRSLIQIHERLVDFNIVNNLES